MQKIKIRLPATLTHFGPGLDTLGLAIGLYTHVELSPRDDNNLIIEQEGEGSDQKMDPFRHPVMLGVNRFFQHIQNSQLGIHIKIKNSIPVNQGLGAQTAFMVAGIIGANNMMGNIYNRQQLIALSAKLSNHQDGAIASFMGGLATSIVSHDSLIYRALPVTPFRLILAIPSNADKLSSESPQLVAMHDVRHNLRHIAMLQQALAEGDLDLLGHALSDPIEQPMIRSNINGFKHIGEIARLNGASGITTTGKGKTIVIFAKNNHDELISALEQAFINLDIKTRLLNVPVDTQGVVISFMQSV